MQAIQQRETGECNLGSMIGRSAGLDSQFKIPEGFTLEAIERVLVRQTLCRSGGKRAEAARCLGVSVRTLQRKLKRWQSDESSESIDVQAGLE